MQQHRDFIRHPYRGWEIRSRLAGASLEEIVRAAAALFLAEACKCNIVLCRQFANDGDAIRAVEERAELWANDFEIDSIRRY